MYKLYWAVIKRYYNLNMEIILNCETYSEIIKRFEYYYKNLETDHSALKHLEYELLTKYRLPQRVVASIISINYVKKMKCTHWRLSRMAPSLWHSYKTAVAVGAPLGIIIRLARNESASPALVAKLFLDQYHLEIACETPENEVIETQEDVSSTTPTVEDKKSKTSVPGKGKNIISKETRDSSLIKDGRLAKEILMTVYYDEQYGPISEMYNRSIGEEYEQLLYKNAKAASLSFQSENDLRMNGYDKTPDLKLNVPIAVDGFVVNWIESKGLFGDKSVHHSYISEQYSSYWNRFGPGLVIYWLGYEESIADIQEKRFIVRAAFPTDIVYMNPLLTIQMDGH